MTGGYKLGHSTLLYMPRLHKCWDIYGGTAVHMYSPHLPCEGEDADVAFRLSRLAHRECLVVASSCTSCGAFAASPFHCDRSRQRRISHVAPVEGMAAICLQRVAWLLLS